MRCGESNGLYWIAYGTISIWNDGHSSRRLEWHGWQNSRKLRMLLIRLYIFCNRVQQLVTTILLYKGHYSKRSISKLIFVSIFQGVMVVSVFSVPLSR